MTGTREFKVKGSPCPTCGKNLDGAMSTEQRPKGPKPGDLSVCAYCGELLNFGTQGAIERLTLEQLADLDLPTRRKLKAAQQLIRERHRQ